MARGNRFLAPRRISRKTDESTSVDTQLDAVSRYAQAYDLQLIPVVPDLDVSGARPIRERPGVGPWLAEERLGEWDGIITYRLDRLFRSQADYVLFYQHYCEERGKVIISTAEGIDTSTEIGNWMALQLVGFAQMERGRMIARRRDAQTRLREAARYAGGKVLYPYEAYKEGPAWYRRPHPERAALVRYWANEVIRGRTCTSLTVETNRKGILTIQGKHWRDGVILRLLRNRGLLGEIWHWPPPRPGDKRPAPVQVLGPDGMPLRIEPIVDDQTWTALQAALDRNASAATASRRRTSPLLGVAYCVLCGTRLHTDRYQRGARQCYVYRCPRREESKAGPGRTCTALSIPGDWLQSLAEDVFLSQVGTAPIMTKITTPDDGHAAEAAQVGRQIANLTEERFVKGVVRDDYDQVMATLTRQHAELSAMPPEPPQVHWEVTWMTDPATGKRRKRTFADEWAVRDAEGRRQLMMQAGFRLNVARTGDGMTVSHRIDDDLAQRAGLAASGLPVNLPADRPWLTAHPWITAHNFYTLDGQRKYFTPGERKVSP